MSTHPGTNQSMKKSTTILLLTDFSAAARRAYPVACRLAGSLSAGLELTHVLPPHTAVPLGPPLSPPVADPPVGLEARLEGIEEALHRECEHLPTGLPVGLRVCVAATVAEGVASAVRDSGAAYVVLASHGHGGLHRLVLGSTADQVLRRSTVPVLIVPAGMPLDEPVHEESAAQLLGQAQEDARSARQALSEHKADPFANIGHAAPTKTAGQSGTRRPR